MIFSPDAEVEDADWIKLSWQLPQTVEGFLRYLRVQDENPQRQKAALHAFMLLPIAAFMPPSLRKSLEAMG